MPTQNAYVTGTRTCNHCRRLLPALAFALAPSGHLYRTCRSCYGERRRHYRLTYRSRREARHQQGRRP